MIEKVRTMCSKGYSQEKIATKLKTTRYIISRIIKEHDIKKVSRNKKHERVVRLYLRGIPAIKVAELTGRTTTSVSMILKKYGVDTYKTKRRKLDESFFQKVNTPKKAYWLGFLYADGNLASKVGRISIRLSMKDIDHLKKFRKDLGSDDVIVTGEQDSFGTKTLFCRIDISSKRMHENLVKLGCTPRKSRKLKFPTSDQVPRHLIFHFIRGYFDGDGSLSYYTCEYGSSQYKVDFSGNYDLLVGIRKSFKKNNKITNYPHKNSSSYQIGGNLQLRDILHKMYYNANTYLTRKHNVYIEYKQYMEVKYIDS